MSDPRFVLLTRKDGSELWVNTHYILSVEPLGNGVAAFEFFDGKSDEFRATDAVRSLLNAPPGPTGERRPPAQSGQRSRPSGERPRDERQKRSRGNEDAGSGSYRWMREARFDSKCARCGGPIYEGEPQLFDTETRAVWCKGCVTRPGREAVPLPPDDDDSDRDMDRAVAADRDPRDDSGPDPFDGADDYPDDEGN